MTECKLSYLPREKLSALVAHYPSIQEALLRQLGLEISILKKWMERRSISEAIAHLYCELFTRHLVVGLAAPGQQLALKLTQYELADALGASLVATNKSARILKSQGFVDFKGAHNILNFAGLAEYSGFNALYLGTP